MTVNNKQPAQPEAYIHDYDGALTEQIIAGRTADIHGAFFLPYLRAGMNLLDCGCGPGTITVGLTQAVSPGNVTGIDLEQSQLELARENAAKLGLTNVKFERGSGYELPYQDNLFDAVFSHAMLEHMHDPLAVLKEIHRVLKPGGLVGIRSTDLAATLIAPAGATLARAYDIWLKYRQHCGGDPLYWASLPSLVTRGGFCKDNRICVKRDLGDTADDSINDICPDSRVYWPENRRNSDSNGLGRSGTDGQCCECAQ